MCGIAGIVHWGNTPEAPALIKRMISAMSHRGPDGNGDWSDRNCAFGHARLSILDIESGAQPMANEDGKIIIVFNGEIYNHRELKKTLIASGHRFSSDHSDTEVIIHGYEEWGEDVLNRLNGMFAFGIWDARNETAFLARDRYGIKPLYVYYCPDQAVVFASEIRSVLASELVRKEASVLGLAEYLSFENMWTGNTLFAGITEFPAAHSESITRGGAKRRRFWDYTFPRSSRAVLAEAADGHRQILKEVIERQIDADVPVMTYLSGGIDSSAVTAVAYQLDRQMQAYTCIFDLNGVGEDRMVDEREFARSVASHLGIRHAELLLPQESLQDSLDMTIAALETPRMGMSYVNYLIAARVAKDAKVVLSGMGGDELHGGYLYRYQMVNQTHPPAESLFQRLMARVPRFSDGRRQLTPYARQTYRKMLNFPIPFEELQEALTPEFYAQIKEFSPYDVMDGLFDACPSKDPWDLVMYVDARTYLHGLLVMEDKLSMAHSLETRVPLLDNELVDYVLELPWTLLCDGKTGKIVFRESVKPWVSEDIYNKPKMGFGPPDASWYRGRLREWISEQLSEKNIRARGIFKPSYVTRVLDEHNSGIRNNVYIIWSLLSLESWCRTFNMFGGKIA